MMTVNNLAASFNNPGVTRTPGRCFVGHPMSEAILEQEPGTADLQKSRRRQPGNSATANIPRIDRLPPSSAEAEQGVLGCVLLSPNDCLGECIEKLKAGPEVFYDLRHQTLFRTLVEMYDERAGIDLITLQQRLKDRQQLEGVGGLAYLASLPDAVPSAAGLGYYLDIVVEKYLLRKMIQTCTSIVGRVFEHEGEVDALLDEVERDIFRICEERVTGSNLSVRDLVHKAISTIEEYHKNQGMLTGIGTGFVDFDKMTTGLHEGEMIVIAARPSVGKTSLAMNIAEHVALELKIPTGVFSLEMTADQLILRMLCSRSRVNLRSIRDGFLAERDFPKLTGAAGKLAAAPLIIDDTSGLSILQLRAKARRMKQQHGIKLFVIDYLQLLNSTSRKADNRQQEIADISGGIKALAKELAVPIIVLSQLNRDVEKRAGEDAKPRLSDLRESGAIEQDADLVGLLYRENQSKDGQDDASEAEQEAIPVNLYVAKQRNGPIGEVKLTFLKSYTRFESAAKIEPENNPNS
jgi:replicative DNA helicase